MKVEIKNGIVWYWDEWFPEDTCDPYWNTNNMLRNTLRAKLLHDQMKDDESYCIWMILK